MSLAKYLARGGEELAPLLKKLKGGAADAVLGREVAGPGNMLHGYAPEGLEDALKARMTPGREALLDFAAEHPEEMSRQRRNTLAGAGGVGLAGYELGKDDDDEDSHLKAVMKKLGL